MTDMKYLTDEKIDEIRDHYEPRSNDNVLEIMHEICARLPWGQEITLSNGKKFFLKKFTEPREKDGVFEFGFDAKFSDDSGHVEFNVTKSGWEFCLTDEWAEKDN